MVNRKSPFLLKRALDPSSCRNQNQKRLSNSSSYGKPAGTRVPSWGDEELFQPQRFLKEFAFLQFFQSRHVVRTCYKTWLLLMANASTNASFMDWWCNISRNHIHLKESNHPKPLISTTMDELWFIVSMFGGIFPHLRHSCLGLLIHLGMTKVYQVSAGL